MYPGPSTPESATGLHDLGKVQLLDPPTMTENFVQREMGYTIARKHGQKLRRLCFISYFLIPIVLTGLTSNADSVACCSRHLSSCDLGICGSGN